jgi:hypothetical protein
MDALRFDDLPMHRFRIPAVLFAEYRTHGRDVVELRAALCHTLSRRVGALRGFVFRTREDTVAGGEYGMNEEIACP